MTNKRKKISASALAALAAFTLLVYFAGPKTKYTGLARLVYNTGYISTFCPGRKIVYSGDGFRFSFLVPTGMEIKQNVDKDGNIRTWFSMGPNQGVGIFFSKSMPAIYRKILKNIADSKRIPAEVNAKIAREGMTLDTLPWILAEVAGFGYPSTSMLVAGSIRKVVFKNGLPAVTFAIAPEPFMEGTPTQYIVVLGTEGQFCKIGSRSMDFTTDYSLYEMWYFRNLNGSPFEFPSPSQDKRAQCQLNTIANSLEFI